MAPILRPDQRDASSTSWWVDAICGVYRELAGRTVLGDGHDHRREPDTVRLPEKNGGARRLTLRDEAGPN